MLNLTLLSFTISSSFQKSPFLHLSSFSNPSFTIFQNVIVQQFFSSFLITQSFYSFSTIERSVFNRFITSLPILCFKSKATNSIISNQTFYGDTIPSNNNKFYNTNYTSIINCKFMSITDNIEEQSIAGGGLCIYSMKSTKVDSCYFFAILSRRSGSAILFEGDYESDEYFESIVVNSIFKSISQDADNDVDLAYTGGAVSYGNLKNTEYGITSYFVYASMTDNCCFDKIRLIGYSECLQIGVLTYVSIFIKSRNLNFTNNEMEGYRFKYGVITFYSSITYDDSFSFINIFNCDFYIYGFFSIVLISNRKQEFSLSFSNFINNECLLGSSYAQFAIDYIKSNETFLKFSNIQYDSKSPYLVVFANEQDVIPIDVTFSNSFFGCSFSSFILNEDYIILNQSSENNIFDYSDFDVDITNNIISNFGYIQTSIFSDTHAFSNVQNSDIYFDLNQDMPLMIEAISYTLGVFAFIGFFLILCYYGRKRNIDIDQFEQLNFDNEINETVIISDTNNLHKNNETDEKFNSDENENEKLDLNL